MEIKYGQMDHPVHISVYAREYVYTFITAIVLIKHKKKKNNFIIESHYYTAADNYKSVYKRVKALRLPTGDVFSIITVRNVYNIISPTSGSI